MNVKTCAFPNSRIGILPETTIKAVRPLSKENLNLGKVWRTEMVIIKDCIGNIFFLSRITLIYSFMGPTEIESNNTMKDEIIFIRNDITLMAFIINNEFWGVDT